MATKFQNAPKTELDKIIRDADASHFGKEYFNDASELLRQELKLQKVKTYSTSEWLNDNIALLAREHQFYTDYALRNWQLQKEKNLTELVKSKRKKERP